MYQLKSVFMFCMLCIIITACNNVKKQTAAGPEVVDIEQIKQRDTLIVGTLFGSTSYVLYRDEYLGYDF